MNLLITGGDDEQRAAIIDRIEDEFDATVGGVRRNSVGTDEHTLEDIETGDQTSILTDDGGARTALEDKSIDVDRLSTITSEAINDAIRKGRLIVIDTISQVEMHSSTFREAVRDAFRGSEDVIAFVENGYVDMYREEGTVISMDGKDTEDVMKTIRSDLNE